MVKSSKTITVLERNLFKNVSKGTAFCDKRKFKRLNYLQWYDTNEKERSFSYTPFDMNFQTILMPKVNSAKILSEKAGLSEPFLIKVCSNK